MREIVDHRQQNIKGSGHHWQAINIRTMAKTIGRARKIKMNRNVLHIENTHITIDPSAEKGQFLQLF
ncbi:hypothetical protein H9X96_10670 [Pedobacter sp. N36a]|uniref:hypothetical protein n=1 Tax=Pedobacter sp. N36a TaxID=2767996 RepID=UPI00165707C7|nr:hypothetical protein [Pedobacter sp. N36a]MBC8986237.1 hypothetical protein [Pedobacter sp. N36a]